YFEGKAVARDYNRALRDFRAAAEAGLPEAQYNMAMLYGQGRGVERDAVQAYMWYSLALAGGEDRAKKALDRLTVEMSPAEITRARKLIADFRVD
ncbi:MAG: tetratricopeptide repeat protein, partial [Kiloniellaceae bacterium]